jgi:hypothetical protein
MSFDRKSHRDHELDARQAAGLPVLNCPNCHARVDHRSGHWVPETIGENGLRVDGHYTCQGTAEPGEALW